MNKFESRGEHQPENPDWLSEFEVLKPEQAHNLDPRLKKLASFGSMAFAMALLNPEGLKAQMVNTADTMGKGNTSTSVAYSYLRDPNFSQHNSFIAQGLGITDKSDVFGGIGITTIKPNGAETTKTQSSIFGGGKINITQKDSLPKISLLSLLSTPLDKRNEGTTTLYCGLVASKKLKVKNFEFTPYGGFSTLIPLGDSQDKLFTPPTPQQSIATGVYKDLGHGTAFYAEFNFGVGENKGKMFTLGLDFPAKDILKKTGKIITRSGKK